MKRNIETLAAYVPELNTAPIRLDANENPVNFLPDYFDEVVDGLKALALNRYPDTDCVRLRQAYSAYCGAPWESIICGNGSDEIIRLLLECYVDKGDRIVVHQPTFSMYSITCQIVGGEAVQVVSEKDFSIDVSRIIDTANENHAKVIFLCNPNNPTGAVFTREQILQVLEGTRAIVAVDEAYYEFYGESVMDCIDQYDRLIVLRTMSKAFGLAGLRVGFGIAGQEIMTLLTKVKPPYNLNSFSQTAAMVYLSHMEEMKTAVAAILSERERIMPILASLSGFQVYPSKSNFIFLKGDTQAVAKATKNLAVLRYFGDYLRITVGTREENDQLIERLRQVAK